MQNDRGRCYRYCAIGERHRCDGSARPTIFGFLSRGVLPRTSLRRVKRSDLNRSNREKKRQNVAVHTYRQCGGLRGVLSSTIRSSSIPEISPLISPTNIYSMNRDSRAWSRRIFPEIVLMFTLKRSLRRPCGSPGKIERDR